MHRLALAAICLVLPVEGVLAEDLCAAAAGVFPGRVCSQSEHGIAITDDPARASELLANAEAGVARFGLHFKRVPDRFAVIEVNDGKIDGAEFDTLRAKGFRAVLPWLSSEGFQQQIEQSVRRAVEQQTGNLPAEAREQIVQEALAKVKEKPPVGGQEAGAIPHELGHMWYAEAFWPGAKHAPGHYGGEGPDWMDETAAVLMESETLVKARVEQFGKRYKELKGTATNGGPVDKLIDLPGFFASSHPAAARGEKLIADLREKDPGALPQNGVLIRAASGPEAERFAEEAIYYYLTATLVSQYLAERSGDPGIFAAIGAALAQGKTTEEWLASNPAPGRLPTNLAALQADWISWLDARFGT